MNYCNWVHISGPKFLKSSAYVKLAKTLSLVVRSFITFFGSRQLCVPKSWKAFKNITSGGQVWIDTNVFSLQPQHRAGSIILTLDMLRGSRNFLHSVCFRFCTIFTDSVSWRILKTSYSKTCQRCQPSGSTAGGSGSSALWRASGWRPVIPLENLFRILGITKTLHVCNLRSFFKEEKASALARLRSLIFN